MTSLHHPFQDSAALREFAAQTQAAIDQGMVNLTWSADSPRRYFTLGLAILGPMELVTVGLAHTDVEMLFRAVIKAVQAGVDPLDRHAIHQEMNLGRPYIQIMPVDPSWITDTCVLRPLGDFYRVTERPIPKVGQVFLADVEGRFPWDHGYRMHEQHDLTLPYSPLNPTQQWWKAGGAK